MNDDSAFRDILRTQLAPDENRAPDFTAVWSAVAARHRRERTRAIGARIGALAAVIALTFLVTHAFRPAKTPSRATAELPWRSAVLLTEWRAPTDALLPVEPFPFQH